MSKIITKNQLNILIESTVEEVKNLVENQNEVKITQQNVDELKNVGHCMCGDKCVVYPEAVVGDASKVTDVMKLITEKGGECVVLERDHMDMLENEGKCDCGGVTLTMETEMEESEVLMDDSTNEEETCVECGSGMSEEEDVDEGNKFAGELAKAREAGDNTFTIDGKEYKVEAVTESVDELTSLINESKNVKINKEEMDFFNKMVNYKK